MYNQCSSEKTPCLGGRCKKKAIYMIGDLKYCPSCVKVIEKRMPHIVVIKIKEK